MGIVRGRASQNGKRGGDVVSVWSRGSGSLPCVGVTVGPVPDHTQALQIPKLVNPLSQIGKYVGQFADPNSQIGKLDSQIGECNSRNWERWCHTIAQIGNKELGGR